MNFEVVFTRKPRVKMFALEKNVKEKKSRQKFFFLPFIAHEAIPLVSLVHIFIYGHISRSTTTSRFSSYRANGILN